MRLIDADALKGEKFYSHERHENCVSVYAIDTMPTIEPDRPHGEWIEKEDYNMDTYYDCSACGNSWCTFDGTPWQNGMNFCPKCGADMRKEGDDSDRA